MDAWIPKWREGLMTHGRWMMDRWMDDNGWMKGRWMNGRLDVCRINGWVDDGEGMRNDGWML